MGPEAVHQARSHSLDAAVFWIVVTLLLIFLAHTLWAVLPAAIFGATLGRVLTLGQFEAFRLAVESADEIEGGLIIERAQPENGATVVTVLFDGAETPYLTTALWPNGTVAGHWPAQTEKDARRNHKAAEAKVA
jgi:hypothetical protein